MTFPLTNSDQCDNFTHGFIHFCGHVLFKGLYWWIPAGSQASPQDRFLVMAAEMDNISSQELAQFWKEVAKNKVMEHRYMFSSR